MLGHEIIIAVCNNKHDYYVSKSLTLSIKVQRVLWFLKSNVLLRFFHINSANTHMLHLRSLCTLKSDRLGLEWHECVCALISALSLTHTHTHTHTHTQCVVQTHATAAINYILLRLKGFYRQYKTGSSHLLVFFEQCLLDVRVFQVCLLLCY